MVLILRFEFRLLWVVVCITLHCKFLGTAQIKWPFVEVVLIVRWS